MDVQRDVFGHAGGRSPFRLGHPAMGHQAVPALHLLFIHRQPADVLRAIPIAPDPCLCGPRLFHLGQRLQPVHRVGILELHGRHLFQRTGQTPVRGYCGTAGALAGPLFTAVIVVHVGPVNLLPVSAALLAWTVVCIHRLIAWKQSAGTAGPAGGAVRDRAETDRPVDKTMDGSVFAGVGLVLRSPYLAGICLLIVLFSSLATFLYFQQAQIVRDSFEDPATRTAVFAAMDFSVNAITLFFQLFLTGRIIRKIGMGWTLALIPLLLMIGFLALGFAPVLTVIVVVQVLRRSGNYAVMRPAREMLYVVVTREEKYKAKNFIDTVVYRGGDAVSAWVYAGLQGAGLAASRIALAAVPLAGIWALISFKLGKRQERMAGSAANPPPDPKGGFHHD